MQLFRDSKFDFMGKRHVFLVLSTLLVIASLAVLFGRSLNLGIDFAGGTQQIIRFQQEPDVDQLRKVLQGAGFGEVGIQTFGEDGDNQVMIKTPLVEGKDEGSAAAIAAALDGEFNKDSGGKPDLNREGVDALADALRFADPDGVGGVDAEDPEAARAHYADAALSIMNIRRADGVFHSWDQIRGVEGVSSEIASFLEQNMVIGSYAVSGGGNVSPQIGSELRRKGILAVVFSMIGMLAYIWLRFELRFGIGAVAAIFHDVIICLGLYAFFGYEFNLTTIAAFLTVVGYSVNDTVVVFDRVRENLRRRRRLPLKEVLNESLNQTLSRTILTSSTTLLVVVSLYVLGGDVIRGLAFVLMTGVLVGTYSSIFVASPFVLLWERYFGREAKAARG